MKVQTLAAGLGVATALVFAGGAASAATTIAITPAVPGTVMDTTTYTANDTVDFTFTIPTGYTFQFATAGFGGTFPAPVGFSASGGSGSFTETFGPYPYHGFLAYSLTTAAIPEPAVWSLMLLGLGALGGALRLTPRKGALALG